ncbi:hypothetical protein Pla175_37310 [Pirellulimonas nuda]|uniref:PEP-CTERM protein-sorting domain-containing protein n=1 Tax=Pirellulimonas nuda TaxID=2528009 RepID=A0A518DFT8_9BACT|nr:hypothetical protein [Pirellulimonas nuda]QDU90328.1 hypothetical protein Pla175_37310 [Pirellulimonas nuda]
MLSSSNAHLTPDAGQAPGGELQATLADGFAPAAGDTFPIASALGTRDAFSQLQLPTLADGLFWRLDATEPMVSLQVLAGAVAGDIGAAQYDQWRQNFGASAVEGLAGAAPVPEPAVGLMAIAAIGKRVARRKRFLTPFLARRSI